MKKSVVLLFSLACVGNSFGMFSKASSVKQIKKTRNFHTSKPAYLDPLGAGAWAMSFINTWSIYEDSGKFIRLENQVKQLEKTVKQNEEKYNLLILKLSEQSKNDATQSKINQE
jgi:hypothetical protein